MAIQSNQISTQTAKQLGLKYFCSLSVGSLHQSSPKREPLDCYVSDSCNRLFFLCGAPPL